MPSVERAVQPMLHQLCQRIARDGLSTVNIPGFRKLEQCGELLGLDKVQYQDMGYSLFSGHRLHSAGVVHPFHTQSHFRHNIVDLVRLQLITANVIEAEEQVIHPVVHFL